MEELTERNSLAAERLTRALNDATTQMETEVPRANRLSVCVMGGLCSLGSTSPRSNSCKQSSKCSEYRSRV